MPGYGTNLAPQEVTALVAFMQTLRPANEPVARDAGFHHRVHSFLTPDE